MERKLRNERFAAAAPLRMRTAADGIDRGILGKVYAESRCEGCAGIDSRPRIRRVALGARRDPAVTRREMPPLDARGCDLAPRLTC